MRKVPPETTRNISFPILISLCCFAAIVYTGCTYQAKDKYRNWREYIVSNKEFKHIPVDTIQQLVVWRTPKAEDNYLNFWLDSITQHCGQIQISFLCETCDSSLLLLTGPGVITYIQGGGKGGGSGCTGTKCGPHGGGDTIYWSLNFPVDIYDPVDSLPKLYQQYPLGVPPGGTPSFSDTAVTVAVFDTGVDTIELKKYLYKNNDPSCLNLFANNGWCFPYNNNITNDDYKPPVGHGATVSRMIVDQVNFYGKNQVRILPIKIHDARGASDLFSVLCGLAYAKERGAKIINASFGYYAPKIPADPGANMQIDSAALLLKDYIKYYLTGNNILLIAAAGNVMNNGDVERKVFTDAGLTPPSDIRNLDSINFYPASLASDPELPNVIAVTTVNDTANKVSPLQNYSSHVVDIGVNADMIIEDDNFYFKNPRIRDGLVQGTSYATPIVSGIICAHYNMIRNHLATAPFDKQDMLEFLLQAGMQLGHHNSPLGVNKIKDGKVMLNNLH